MKHVKSFKLYENVNSEIKTFGPDEHLEFCKAVAEMAKGREVRWDLYDNPYSHEHVMGKEDRRSLINKKLGEMGMTRTEYLDILSNDPEEGRRLSDELHARLQSEDEFGKRHTVLRPEVLGSSKITKGGHQILPSKRYWDMYVKDGAEASIVEQDGKLILFIHKDGEIVRGWGDKPMAFDNMDMPIRIEDVSSLEALI